MTQLVWLGDYQEGKKVKGDGKGDIAGEWGENRPGSAEGQLCAGCSDLSRRTGFVFFVFHKRPGHAARAV